MKNIKWLVFVVLAVILMVTPLVVSCAEEAPTPTPAPAPTPEVFELKLADYMAPGTSAAVELDIFADTVARCTEGRVKIDVYHAETLGKLADHLDMMKGGVCDIIKTGPPLSVHFPMVMAGTELPMLGVPNNPVALQMRWELFYKGYFSALDDYKVCAFTPTGMFRLWMRDKKLLTAEDFKGLKIRGSGPVMTKPFEHFGAAATSIATPECYMALDRGILDIMMTVAHFAVSNKYNEVVKYAVRQPVLVGAPPLLMSKEVWNGLPTDIQLHMNQAFAEFVYDQLLYYQPQWDESLAKIEEGGVEVYDFPASEWARLEEAAGPAIDEWVAETEAKGLPAKEMVAYMKAIMARYK